MCGIVGYIGKNIAIKKIIEKLKILEYRGYDSAGIAVFEKDKIGIVKSVGNISVLEKKIKNKDNYDIGIGHTRWATNGDVSIKNSHPHVSFDGKWVIVHNGIIENTSKLKEEYLKDISLKSSTDSEIIAHLIALEAGNSLQKISKTLKKLNGSWALAILNKDENDTIYLAKNKSPLYCTCNDNEAFIASDPICFLSESSDYFSLKDGQIAKIKSNKIEVYDGFLNKTVAKYYKLNEKKYDIEKNGYEHFMLKEINDTKDVFKNICEVYQDENPFSKLKIDWDSITKIKIIGCGTAYNSGLVGADYLKKVLKIDCEACISSEFRYSNPLIDKNTLCIFVSQSGETADTLECIKYAKRKRVKVISLTNVMYSSITKLSKNVLPICAGREIAVASTKAYSCQLAVFYLLSKWLESKKKNDKRIYTRSIKNVLKLSKMVDGFDTLQIKEIAKQLQGENNVFFLGRKMDYFIAIEAALKLKEIAYINANAYPCGELKHGYIALIENKTPVFVFATDRKIFDKTLNCVNEVNSRGAKTILISQIKLKENEKNGVSYVVNIKCKGITRELYIVISVIFAQYLAYYTSISKGNNPDQPRNLAKSVTVE